MALTTAPGAWIGAPAVLVSREAASSFAAAVDETREEFLSGSILVPTYAVTLAWDVQNRVLNEVLPDALGLHGEQAFRFFSPIAPGMEVNSRARLECIAPRSSGTTVTVRTETFDGSVLLCTQLFTVFVVGETLPPWGTSTDLTPDHPSSEVGDPRRLQELTEVLPQDQPSRYAKASGDSYQIHVDETYAKAMGLSGPIAHGMTTLAYAARAVRESIRNDASLSYLAARFSASVTPGSSLKTSVYAADEGDSQLSGTFETVADGVTSVITHGRFVASASSGAKNLNPTQSHDRKAG